MSATDWKPIKKRAVRAAEDLGHKLGHFSRTRGSERMALCDTCGGFCWIALHPTRGFTAGGRLLHYRCGTPEAAGFRGAE